MSLKPLYRFCPECKRQFSYNPSVGDLGIICKNCGKPYNPIGYIIKKGGKKK